MALTQATDESLDRLHGLCSDASQGQARKLSHLDRRVGTRDQVASDRSAVLISLPKRRIWTIDESLVWQYPLSIKRTKTVLCWQLRL
jgi:hypothetical protein